MEIQITIRGKYTDGQNFSVNTNSIETAISELEMIEQNEHAFDADEPVEDGPYLIH